MVSGGQLFGPIIMPFGGSAVLQLLAVASFLHIRGAWPHRLVDDRVLVVLPKYPADVRVITPVVVPRGDRCSVRSLG